MPRLINGSTGVVVIVDDVTAAGLGPEWSEQGGGTKPPAKTAKPATKRVSKKSATPAEEAPASTDDDSAADRAALPTDK